MVMPLGKRGLYQLHEQLLAHNVHLHGAYVTRQTAIMVLDGCDSAARRHLRLTSHSGEQIRLPLADNRYIGSSFIVILDDLSEIQITHHMASSNDNIFLYSSVKVIPLL